MRAFSRLLLMVLIISGLIIVSAVDSYASFQEYGTLSFVVKESEYLYDNIRYQFDNVIMLDYGLQINEGNVIGCSYLSLNYSQKYDVLLFGLRKGYFAYQSGNFQFELGKNRIMYGVGYVWNPSDIINPRKSPLYRDEKKRDDEGVYYGSLSYYGFLDNLAYEIRGVFLPAKEDLMESREVLSLKLSWQPLETTCVLGFKADEKPIYAGNIRYTLSSFPVTVYGEFCHHETDDLRQYLLGFQFDPSFEILDGNIQGQFEYFRNENSYQHEVVAYYDYYPGKAPTLGELYQNYLYTGLTYYSLDFSVSLGIIKNIDNDGSGIINYLVNYPLNDESSLSLGGYLPFGRDVDKFPYFTNKNHEIYLMLSVSFGI